MHGKLCFAQEHSKAENAQHDSILHLHFTRSINSDGAGRTSMNTGIYILLTSFHPQYSSFLSVVISGHHWTIYKWAGNMCCLAAASVEGNLSEHEDVLLVTIFI